MFVIVDCHWKSKEEKRSDEGKSGDGFLVCWSWLRGVVEVKLGGNEDGSGDEKC